MDRKHAVWWETHWSFCHFKILMASRGRWPSLGRLPTAMLLSNVCRNASQPLVSTPFSSQQTGQPEQHCDVDKGCELTQLETMTFPFIYHHMSTWVGRALLPSCLKSTKQDLDKDEHIEIDLFWKIEYHLKKYCLAGLVNNSLSLWVWSQWRYLHVPPGALQLLLALSPVSGGTAAPGGWLKKSHFVIHSADPFISVFAHCLGNFNSTQFHEVSQLFCTSTHVVTHPQSVIHVLKPTLLCWEIGLCRQNKSCFVFCALQDLLMFYSL